VNETSARRPSTVPRTLATLATFALLALGAGRAAARDVTLLNASYDVTRELYKDVNAAFAAAYKKKTGDTVTINQAHGGSSKQARAVIEGMQADVVTMNQALDIDAIAQSGLIPTDWPARLPNHAVPFTSTILFLVRAGNPKQIRDWGDLVKPGVIPIIPNPKTSGNGRYSYLAAWAYALRQSKGDAAAARDFVGKLFRAVPVLDTGGRGASTTFVERKIGDVLLTFENEINLATAATSGGLTVVVPSVSILAETPVAVVDKVAAKHGTTEVATAYLQFLFSPEGQEIGARHHLRPVTPAALAKAPFPKLELVSVSALGGWPALQKQHFADGGVFDQIFAQK
jgi:sulfate transport system substrate-binding protein